MIIFFILILALKMEVNFVVLGKKNHGHVITYFLVPVRKAGL
jgi:hypothetical protein